MSTAATGKVPQRGTFQQSCVPPGYRAEDREKEIVAQTFDDIRERAVCFKIDRSWRSTMTGEEVSERIRRAWRMNPGRHDPEIALGVRLGKVIAVLRIDRWTQLDGGRWRFEGERDDPLEREYLGIDVTGLYAGSSNPVRYLNC